MTAATRPSGPPRAIRCLIRFSAHDRATGSVAHGVEGMIDIPADTRLPTLWVAARRAAGEQIGIPGLLALEDIRIARYAGVHAMGA